MNGTTSTNHIIYFIFMVYLLKHCNTASKCRNVQFTKIVIKIITLLQKKELNIQCKNTQATNLWQKNIKGTRCPGSVELVAKKHLKLSVTNCIRIDNSKEEQNNPHKHPQKLHGPPPTLRKNTVVHSMESKFWLNKMADPPVHDAKGKPYNPVACLRGPPYSIFKPSIQPQSVKHSITNRSQTPA